MTQPLDGIKVIELAEGIAGPYAGKLLADFGADVIKVEPPGGDRARRLGPFPDAMVDLDRSATFLHLNTNKRSIVAEVDDPIVADLAAGADVVIASQAELDVEALRERNPRLVVVSVTAFGLTGPYAGYHGEEIVHLAVGGPMSASGSPDREPVKMAGAIGQYQCGSIAAVAALSAQMTAARSGTGAHVDVSNVETQLGSIDRRMSYLLYGAYRGEDVARTGGYSVGALSNGCRPAADGHVQVSTLVNWIPRMLDVVDEDDLRQLYDDPEWLFNEALPEIVDAHLLAWTLSRDRQSAMAEAQAAGWPVTAVNLPVDLLDDEHFADRGFFVPVEQATGETVRQPGPPIKLDDGWAVRLPAPLLDQHRTEIEAELAEADGDSAIVPGASAAYSSAPGAATATASTLPLDGVRVLDMTVVWAGPYATCLLGDLGADVIRVDNPYIFPSATRGVLPRPPKELTDDIGGIFGGYPDAEPGERPWNRVALFNAHARNKRSVTLDLRKESGREAFLRLAEQCDVMIENNSLDLLTKLGIDWDELHARNERLILIRMPWVGLSGPYREYLGFGVNFEALCGLGALRGYPDVDLSENESVFHMDAASGSAGAYAALMALRRRQSTGVGELVELSQAENMLNHIGEYLIDAERTGVTHERLGNRHPQRAPQGCYRCEGDDAWVAISVGDDEWPGFVAATGDAPFTTDERFMTEAGRRANHDDLDAAITAWTSSLTPHEVFERCQANGVPAGPVLHELETLENPHFAARDMFRPNGSAEAGQHPYPGHVWRWDGPPLRWSELPVMGAHNESVFKDLVGMSDGEYETLVADGHITFDYLHADGTSM